MTPARPPRLGLTTSVLAVLLVVVAGEQIAAGAPQAAAPAPTLSPAAQVPGPTTTPAPVDAGRPRRWTPAEGRPTGPDVLDEAVFVALDVGACLTWLAPGNISVVPCGGAHSAEVTSRRDITADFARTPTQDEITALSKRICPAARRAWTGGDVAANVDGYLWRYDGGPPGPAVHRLLCTAALAGYGTFTGTLRAAP